MFMIFVLMSTKFEIIHMSTNTIMKILDMYMLACIFQLRMHLMAVWLTFCDTKIDPEDSDSDKLNLPS